MQVQRVQSQQSFTNGRLIYVSQIGGLKYSDKVGKYLPKSPTMSMTLANVRKYISKLPFDVYIIESEKNPEFYEIVANKSHHNFVYGPENEKHKHHFVSKSIFETVIMDAVETVCTAYKKIIKP